jgi:PKD repeat protein
VDIRTKETFDLLKPVINGINNTFYIDSVTNSGSGKFKIYSTNTLWLTLGYNVTINSVDYLIVDLMPNEWIEVEGVSIPTATQFNIYSPFFVHGNILAQNQLMNLIPNSQDKLPMIWLHEKTKEKFNNDPLSYIDRESDLELYFLIDNNITDWLQLEEDRYALKPMRNLINAFVDACNDYPLILRPFDYDVSDAPKFGSYVDSKGNVKQIFKDRVSGSEFKATITFIKDSECEPIQTGCPTIMTADFSANLLTAGIGQNIQFNDLTTESPTHWSWRFGDGTGSNVQNPLKSYSAVGVYDVTLLAGRIQKGDVKIKTGLISIVGTGMVASFNSSPLNGLAPLSVSFTDTTTNSPTSWLWSVAGGVLGVDYVYTSGSSTSQNPVIRFETPNLYTVTLQASNISQSDLSDPTNIDAQQFTPFNRSNRLAGYNSENVIKDGSNNISQVTDLFSGGFHLTPQAGVNSPLYIANVQNGKPSINCSVSQFVRNVSFANSQPLSIYIVARSTAVSSAYLGSIVGQLEVFRRGGGAQGLFAGNSVIGTNGNDSNFHILSSLINGVSSSISVDLLSSEAGDVGTAGISGLVVGRANLGGEQLFGDILAVYIYSGVDDNTTKNKMINYLKTYYNL